MIVQAASALPRFWNQRSRLKSVIYGPSIPSDPLVAVVPSVLEKVLNFIPLHPHASAFVSLNSLLIDRGTPLPSYFNDLPILIHLAFLLHPQIGGRGLEKIALDYLSDEEGKDVDIEVLEEAPAVFQTPRRRRSRKAKEEINDAFLRRSTRLSKKAEGFKDAASARKNKQAARPTTSDEEVVDATPLPMIPGSPKDGPAPHLSKDILKGIATGFLQIPPEAASAALLDEDDADEES